ncbi:Uncharacterized conserved protein, DUF58 family, contains vWF domain [Saccharicrinis carchari]|uniref:Uncharacterized conserved protein, DUF58 family, contains vWF domain n=1 Tax=Saccharicrinis carchari TaxID=1168039 RepID=A0A521EQ54_SACCC|nr:DUF58 domain-containing protein [Saccharicrinis carchari]SMO86025.1 Uncharacterized conserved protein, DUF58 family, contains vWF domain [Saccharicrinis carchari]
MRKRWKSIFITYRFYISLALIIVLMLLGQYFPVFYVAAQLTFWLFVLLLVVDALLLYGARNKQNLQAKRILPTRFSNGDKNRVELHFTSRFSCKAKITLIDELPVQFQMRDFEEKFTLQPGQEKTFCYQLVPVERGEYYFGALHLFICSPIAFISRRYSFNQNAMVKVYPGLIEMRRFELMAISNRLTEIGVKKIRRIGHQMEFDQIRDYITGDDYRTLNWKATARKNRLMVNQYQDEKSQQIYSLIDMGRTMQMPFNGMSLLDYAINTSLVISNIAMLKHDKAGLFTYSDTLHSIVPAASNGRHLQHIMEVLYNQHTNYKEPNLELLYAQIKRRVHQRSLMVLYTNFESLISARRQLPFLQRLAKSHLLVVVFFENTEVHQLAQQRTQSTEDIYIKTIAEKFVFDKKRIVRELKQHGIHAVLSAPSDLTVNTINKYLEIKARGLL